MAIPVKLNVQQFNELRQGQKDVVTAQNDLAEAIRTGFASLVDALNNLNDSDSDPGTTEGELVARYKFTEDQQPVSFDLVFKGGKSAKGTAVGAGDIDLSVESSSDAIEAKIGEPVRSEDGNEVKASVTLTGGVMEKADLVVVTYKATNRDTGNAVAADADEFETGPGEVAIGTLDSPVPLTEVPANPPAPTE